MVEEEAVVTVEVEEEVSLTTILMEVKKKQPFFIYSPPLMFSLSLYPIRSLS